METAPKADTWRCTPEGDSPADDITQGLHPAELKVKHRYSPGPEFLCKAAECWTENKVETPLEDAKRERKRPRWVGVSQDTEPVLGWKRYSSLAKLRRVLEYAMRLAKNTRVKKELRHTIAT